MEIKEYQSLNSFWKVNKKYIFNQVGNSFLKRKLTSGSLNQTILILFRIWIILKTEFEV
jgi:hypothetical protein